MAQPETVVKIDSVAKTDPARQLTGWGTSLAIHLPYILMFLLFAWGAPLIEPAPEEKAIEVRADDLPKHNFDNEDVGIDPSKQLNYKVDRIEDVSVPGVLRPQDAVGVAGAPSGMPQSIAPPPGLGSGPGGSSTIGPATGVFAGDLGGYIGGRLIPGQMFDGRSGATREKMVAEGGGNAASEAAVSKGLKWLKAQQRSAGNWTMIEGTEQDDFGATGLALLPFLGAGITHQGHRTDPAHTEYVKTVERGLHWLTSKQASNGLMGKGIISRHYSHAICTMVLCEAYGMTGDAALKRPAQRALDYLLTAQHHEGGFRYEAATEAGDTSVTGWCLQALHSGRLAGLVVPSEAFVKVGKFLDTVQSQNGAAYGYTNPGNRSTMTAVGLLCRAYLGWRPKLPPMIAGVENLKRLPPSKADRDIYYDYYATQVVHFCASPADWKAWNPNIRDLLINTQNNTGGPKRGSWDPEDSQTGRGGGRIAVTSLSLLTLEVYYRYLPLYRRDKSGSE